VTRSTRRSLSLIPLLGVEVSDIRLANDRLGSVGSASTQPVNETLIARKSNATFKIHSVGKDT